MLHILSTLVLGTWYMFLPLDVCYFSKTLQVKLFQFFNVYYYYTRVLQHQNTIH